MNLSMESNPNPNLGASRNPMSQSQPQPQAQPQGQPQVQPQPPTKQIPIITREILALLTPQQLQQFKSHPQFQQIMHNFMQLQQQQQQQQPQQQLPGSQAMPPLAHPQASQQIPQQNPQHPSLHPAPQATQPFYPQSHQSQPQVRSRQPQHMHQQQQPPHANIHRQPFQGGAPSSHASPTMAAASRPVQSLQMPMPPYAFEDGSGKLPADIRHGVMPGTLISANGPRQNSLGQMHPAPVPPSMMQLPADPRQVPLPIAQPQIPPSAAIQGSRTRSDVPEMLAHRPEIPLAQLKDLHEWLDKYKSEGKDVPLDISVYETLITRDSKYDIQARNQALSNRATLEQMAKDVHSYNHIKQLRMSAINATMKNQISNSIWGEGYQGYGNGTTNTVTKLLLPPPDKTDRQINEPVLKRINQESELVPIRLEFEQERDRFKLRDTFVWDRNEEGLLLERFVRQMLNDYKFLDPQYWEPVVASIKEQINDYQKKPALATGELRVPIKIDITMNNAQLTDQIEWDILNAQDGDPEEFATIMCDEMGLAGDFCTAVAHTIREQVQAYLKALHIVGYSFDGLSIQEDEIRSRVLPHLRNSSADSGFADDFILILRNPSNVGDFSPVIVRLSRMEIERLDKEIERDSRRKRRHGASDHEPQTNGLSRHTTSRRLAVHTGRGGPTIPELSDVPKTFRTPYCSSVLPGAIDFGVPKVHEYTEVFAQKNQVPNPDYKPPPPPRDRYRVRYQHDPTIGTFFVKIKMPRPY